MSVEQDYEALLNSIDHWTGWLATIVATEDGAVVNNIGNSSGIGNHLDLKLLLRLRSLSSVIVTTGATARAESYKSTNLGPLAFITRSPDSLKNVPAIKHPGDFANTFLTPPEHAALFEWCNTKLLENGATAILFEGGASSLTQLWSASFPVQLIFTVANSSNPTGLDVQKVARLALPELKLNRPVQEFSIGTNRVSRWLNAST